MQRIVFSIDYGIRNLIKILKIRDGHRTLKLPEDPDKGIPIPSCPSVVWLPVLVGRTVLDGFKDAAKGGETDEPIFLTVLPVKTGLV